MRGETTVFIRDAFFDERGRRLLVPCGTVWTNPVTGTVSFKYYARYLDLGERAVPVDPVNLPLASRTFDLGRHCSTAIRDAGPDGWGRTVLDCCVNTKSFTTLDYIVFPNPGRLGNLDFGQFSELSVANIREIPSLKEAARKIEEIGMLPAKIVRKSLPYSSGIGGSRPKANIIDDEGVLWIAKFPSLGDGRPEAVLELATLRLASECGIDACHAEVDDDGETLFVRRFDRTPDGARTGFLSAHSVLGMKEKVDREELRDYRILAEKIRIFGFPDDLPELFRRIAFNVIVRNQDDHERNHGFLVHDKKIRLAPAYDLVPTGLSPDMRRPPQMVMRIGPRGHEGSRENLVLAAGKFGLSSDEAASIFDSVAANVGMAWRRVFSECGVPEDNIGHVANVLAYWEKQETGFRHGL